MSIYGISDLHLSISIPNKTMEVFGSRWNNYINRLEENWNEIVKEDDLVIIPGDISWCTRLRETDNDFKFLDNLSGNKFISKGNHDYWFSTFNKVSKHLDSNYNSIHLIERDYYHLLDVGYKYVITGFKGFNPYISNIVKERELKKKYNTLNTQLKEINDQYPGIPIILGYHFPPLFENELRFHKLFQSHNVKQVLYGHTHIGYNKMFIGNKDDINYHFIAADYLEFKPKLIL